MAPPNKYYVLGKAIPPNKDKPLEAFLQESGNFGLIGVAMDKEQRQLDLSGLALGREHRGKPIGRVETSRFYENDGTHFIAILDEAPEGVRSLRAYQTSELIRRKLLDGVSTRHKGEAWVDEQSGILRVKKDFDEVTLTDDPFLTDCRIDFMINVEDVHKHLGIQGEENEANRLSRVQEFLFSNRKDLKGIFDSPDFERWTHLQTSPTTTTTTTTAAATTESGTTSTLTATDVPKGKKKEVFQEKADHENQPNESPEVDLPPSPSLFPPSPVPPSHPPLERPNGDPKGSSFDVSTHPSESKTALGSKQQETILKPVILERTLAFSNHKTLLSPSPLPSKKTQELLRLYNMTSTPAEIPASKVPATPSSTDGPPPTSSPAPEKKRSYSSLSDYSLNPDADPELQAYEARLKRAKLLYEQVKNREIEVNQIKPEDMRDDLLILVHDMKSKQDQEEEMKREKEKEKLRAALTGLAKFTDGDKAVPGEQDPKQDIEKFIGSIDPLGLSTATRLLEGISAFNATSAQKARESREEADKLRALLEHRQTSGYDTTLRMMEKYDNAKKKTGPFASPESRFESGRHVFIPSGARNADPYGRGNTEKVLFPLAGERGPAFPPTTETSVPLASPRPAGVPHAEAPLQHLPSPALYTDVQMDIPTRGSRAREVFERSEAVRKLFANTAKTGMDTTMFCDVMENIIANQ